MINRSKGEMEKYIHKKINVYELHNKLLDLLEEYRALHLII